MSEHPKLPWRGYVIVRTVGSVSKTLVGLGLPSDKTTVYEWKADPLYPITFASTVVAQASGSTSCPGAPCPTPHRRDVKRNTSGAPAYEAALRANAGRWPAWAVDCVERIAALEGDSGRDEAAWWRCSTSCTPPFISSSRTRLRARAKRT